MLHLILSPLLLPVTSYSTKILWSSMISPKPSEFPGIDDIAQQRLVIVGAPLPSALAIAPFRFYRGDPIPKRIWLISSLEGEIQFSRTSDNEVTLFRESGFIQGAEVAVRDFSQFPFEQGEEIKLGGMTVIIDSLNEAGMPTRLTLRFDSAIEDMNVNFLRWDAESESYQSVSM